MLCMGMLCMYVKVNVNVLVKYLLYKLMVFFCIMCIILCIMVRVRVCLLFMIYNQRIVCIKTSSFPELRVALRVEL